jgi:hypothetical protein
MPARVMPAVRLVPGRHVPGRAANSMNGASMLLARHGWSIDVVPEAGDG